MDAAGNLFVADFGHYTVLEFDTPLSADGTADCVFGQSGTVTATTENNGSLSDNSRGRPSDLTFDAQRNV